MTDELIPISLEFKVSQQAPLTSFAGLFFVVMVVLCIVICVARSMIYAAEPLDCDNTECSWTLSDVPWRTKVPSIENH